MSVEFITKDAEAIKQVKALYVSAFERGLRNGEWALLGQAYLHDGSNSVRVKVTLIPKPYNQQILAVTTRMSAAERRKKRAAKPKRKARP